MVFSYGNPRRLIHPCYEKHTPFKYTLLCIANLAYLLSWPSLGSLPLASGHPASSLCQAFQKSSLYSRSPPPHWSAHRIASLLCPSTCSGSGRAAVCLIRIHSWNPHQLKRQSRPYPHSTGENLPDSSIYLSGLSMACENVDFLLAALHWQKRGVKPGHAF